MASLRSPMQLLTFTIDTQPYAILSRSVIEVLPLVPARPLPLMPDYVRGIFTYRGHLVPLIDLGQRLASRAVEERLSTRVIVVEFIRPADASKAPVRLGLVAENVISICSAEDADTTLPAMELEHAPFLGSLLRLNGRTVQLILIGRLLPPTLLDGLFPIPLADPVAIGGEPL
ncbi:MAG: chemotaxis protein CheW [Planctomycetia bacterium]|nr:chemotaxis protein CheW [Planctomycetia bacterium]